MFRDFHILLTVSAKNLGVAMKESPKSSHEKFKKLNKDTLYKGISRKKKIKSRLTPTYLEELSSRICLPSDILAGAPVITATGRNELRLENYKGIIEYNGNVIKVQTKICKVCIEGKQLNILYFTEDEMRITGHIQAIYYQ
jgi:sporulation protein YqfC